jgi:tetratricopeptide (TPR) repeat protein
MKKSLASELEAELNLARGAFAKRDLGSSLRHINLVLSKDPSCAQAHFGKGMIFVANSRPRDALDSFLKAHNASPYNVETLLWVTQIFLTLGMEKEAEPYARTLIGIQPNMGRGFFLLASSLERQNRLTEAVRAIDRAIKLEPSQPNYLLTKARLLKSSRLPSQAAEVLRQALDLRSEPEAAFQLAGLLADEGLTSASVDLIDRFAFPLPIPDRPHVLMARVFTEAQDFERAEECWRLAAEYSPDADIAVTRIDSEIAAGRLVIAEDLLRIGIEREPSSPELLSRLTKIRKITSADENLLERMQALLCRTDLSTQAARELNFGLGKAYDDLGEYGRAMTFFDEAHRIDSFAYPEAKQFDISHWQAFTDFQIRFFTKDRIREFAAKGLESNLPLFVTGMIRSGTTLTEQILSGHSKIAAGGEKSFWADHRNDIMDATQDKFDFPTALRLGREFLRMLDLQNGNSEHVIEKNPTNFLFATALHSVFPRAKIVHVRRHPVDNVLSIWTTQLTSAVAFASDRRNLVNAYREYRRLVDHLEHVLPDHIFRSFTYEDITSRPKTAVESMLDFLGVEYESGCFAPETNSRTVRTPSLLQVRQPIHTASQARWIKYEPWLGPFAELLDERN